MMRPLFGKLGRLMVSGLEHLSPIELSTSAKYNGFKQAQAQLYGTGGFRYGAAGRGLSEVFQYEQGAIQAAATSAIGQGHGVAVSAAGLPRLPLIKGYFGGYTRNNMMNMGMGIGMTKEEEATRRIRMMVRGAAPLAIGATSLSSMMFGSDSMPAAMGRTAIAGAGHLGIGTALGARYPMAGAAYLGVSGINMMRRGNNFGPF